MYGFKVSRRIHFPLLALVGKKLILPRNHILWLNLCNLTLPEVGKYFGTDHMALRLPCVFLYPLFLIFLVNLKEAGERSCPAWTRSLTWPLAPMQPLHAWLQTLVSTSASAPPYNWCSGKWHAISLRLCIQPLHHLLSFSRCSIISYEKSWYSLFR